MTPLERLKASPDFVRQTEPVDIAEAEALVGHALPDDLRDLLSTCAEFRAFFGENYFWLNPVREFIEINTNADIRECYPGQLIFASSGGGEYYALNTTVTPPRYAVVPAIGGPEDAIDQGPSLNHLLERLEQGRLFDEPPE